MRRRSAALLGCALALALLIASLAAEAQPNDRVYRIGMLAPDARQISGRFWERLRELGWIEGKTLIVERRFSSTSAERYADLASELVGLNVDVVVSVTTPPTAPAKKATTNIPTVFIDVADPVGSGFAMSFAHPGGNLTGLSSINSELSAKRLDLLRGAVPSLSRVAVLACCFGTPSDAVVLQKFLDNTVAAAKAITVSAHPIGVKNLDDPAALFAAIVKDRADGLIVQPSSRGIDYMLRARLADFAIKHRLPTIFSDRRHVEAGGLMSYSIDRPDMYGRAAAFVDRILKGAKPADLPVEQPTKFELVINLKTAKALGLTIPPSLLQRADEVIHL